ncbi:MAG: PqqD family protein [Verrucomicrobia bacterium]|nr:PqqD family protein [Verrucomicrobiota bacterium]MBU1909926.1 PqqD family protein [Verrucomicrobiota bacterium]
MPVCYHQNADIVTRRIAGETLLVPIRQHLADLQRIYVLDEVGEAIWGALDGNRDAEQIASLLAEDFDVAGETALADVRAFCRELLEAGLVRVTE